MWWIPLIGCGGHDPRRPPVDRLPTTEPAPPPTPVDGVFADCADAGVTLSWRGEDADAVTAVAPLPGGRVVALRHAGELTLGGEKLAPLGELAWQVARVDDDGQLAFRTPFEGSSQATLAAIADAGDGGVFVAGAGDGLSLLGGAPLGGGGESDAFVARLGPDGSLVWLRVVGGASEDAALGLAVLPGGDVVAVGTIGETRATFGVDEPTQTRILPPTDALETAWVARFSGADGALAWVRSEGGAERTRPTAVAAAGDGVVVAGEVSGLGATVFFDGTRVEPGAADVVTFVAAWDDRGALGWVAEAAGAAPSAVVAGDDGGAWAAGTFGPLATFGRAEPAETTLETGTLAGWVARWGAGGELAWARALESTEALATAQGLARRGSGAVVVGRAAGLLLDGEAFPPSLDGYVLDLGADGEVGCALRLPMSGGGELHGVALAPGGELEVWGSAAGEVVFAEGTADERAVTSETPDAFVTTLRWLQ